MKFQVPRGQRGALRAAVGTASARTTRLQAVYADTVGSHLAAAGMALRLRKEGRVWVQTLKGRGDGLASRFEHEVVLPCVQGLPTLNASRHNGTPLATTLQRALREGGALQTVYRTDIQRLHRRVRFQGALIELALDRGHLIAGDRRLPVHEIEFELVSGPATALPQLAATWARRFGLWWDVRTKSEQGFRLAHGLKSVPAATAQLPEAGALGGHDALADLLAQAMPPAAELAGGTGSDVHVAHLQRGLQAMVQVVKPLDHEAHASVQRLLADLQRDASPVPVLLRGVSFTALMLRLLQLQLDLSTQAGQQPAARR